MLSSCSLIYKICDYCNLKYEGIVNIIITEDYNYSYHKSCIDLYKKPKINKSLSEINIDSDISSIIVSVKDQINKIGIEFDENTQNNTSNSFVKSIVDSKMSIHKFNNYINIYIVSKKADVLKSSQFHGGYAAGKAIGNNVFISQGFNELRFKGILAHELTHVWQYQNNILSGQTRKINVEGLAELVQAHIFKMDTTNSGKAMYKSQKYQRYKIYREGYKKMKYYLELYGWEELLERYTYYY